MSTDTKLPILYSFRRCPYAMRARLAIAVAGQQCELREILLRDKAAKFLETSPKGTVPVLVDVDGTVLEESIDLMDWALAKHDPESWLKPESGTLEEMKALVAESDGPFKTALDRYKYASRYEGADALAEREKASVFLRKLDAKLEKSKFLFGSHMSYADAGIVTFVRQFANVNRDWFNAQNWPHLIRWLDAFLESELFASIMQKYPKWETGDEVTVFG